MIDLVTVTEAKIHAHLDLMDPNMVDADVVFKIKAASQMVASLLKIPDPPTAYENAGTSPVTYTIPPHVKALTLLAFSELWENRESTVVNVLSDGIERMVTMYRDPTMA